MPQQFEAQKIQYPAELPEVKSRTGHEQIHGVADLTLVVIAQCPVIVLEVADDWFDGRTAMESLPGLPLV